jgi:mono/diheme cytochrome c family protein
MTVIPSIVKKGALLGLLFFLSYTTIKAQDGKTIFSSNCAQCHALDKSLTGPALRGVETRGPWTDRKELVKWVHNPAGYIPTTPYTQQLAAQYNGQIMPSFPQLSEKDITAIFDYIRDAPVPGPSGDPRIPGEPEASSSGQLIFGIISIVLALVALILMQVNSNLKKLSDDKEQILRPEPVPFWRNKIYIALFAVVFFVVGGFFVAKSAIGLGRQKDYQPDQPIYFSHKVHAGINQINCLYCHNSAFEGKHAGIPTLNICMNCHKAINEYAGPQLHDEEGNEINGTTEIGKLYKYAGFTPGPGAQWDPSKAKSPEWVKIHNLPDHVYFNHAQHTRVGGVACQSCHGNIQEMDKVYQASELSMGWCINCHRESKVQFNYSDSTGNQFYSIYEKFHNDIKSGRMDSVSVADIGGLECQKCHY